MPRPLDLLEWILFNVFIKPTIAINFDFRQLGESFLIHKTYFMAIGISEYNYANSCFARCIQRYQRCQDRIVCLLNDLIDLRLHV